MRGRLPGGPEAVWEMSGSDEARQRLEVILEVVAGRCRVQEACERLQLSPSRLEQLRSRALQAALEALEPRPTGRPTQPPNPLAGQLAELQDQIRQLQRELVLSRAREELAPLQNCTAPVPPKKRTVRKRRRQTR